MFTVRFERPSGGYDVLECQRYSVSDDADTDADSSKARIDGKTIRLYTTLDDESPRFEYVGPTQPYAVAYVTNSAGKTVDRIA